MRGGKYLAEERGAFEPDEAAAPAVSEAQAPSDTACAPLYEFAASHDQQPAVDWLRVFMREWHAERE
jgi:hypothetical protein